MWLTRAGRPGCVWWLMLGWRLGRDRAWSCKHVVEVFVCVVLKVVVMAKVVGEGGGLAVVASGRERLCRLACGAVALVLLLQGHMVLDQG